MNKLSKEFISYVKSFNKQPGEFTKDEIYQIGLEHKKQVIKSWQELVELIGWEKSAESLRCYIKNRLCSEGGLEKNMNLLSNRTIDDITAEDLIEKKQALMIQAQKTRDEATSYRKAIRDTARIEEFKDIIKDTVNKLSNLPKVKICNNSNVLDNEMIISFGDLHIGQEFSNYYNTYNVNIAYERISKYLSKIEYYCKLYRPSRIILLNLGDLISGTIHTTLRLEQSINVIEQIMTASEILANMLNELQAFAPEVVYKSVTDNHSRCMANKMENIEKENLNKIIDWYVKARLENTKIQFPNNNLGDDIGICELKNGKILIFTHGHMDSKNQIVQNMFGLIKKFPDYILMGHYHNCSEHTFQNCKVYVNGSIIGPDTYAYEKRLFSEPEQKILVFNKDNDVININVNLK